MSDTKLKITPLFPSRTIAQNGVRLDVVNGSYIFSLDHGSFTVSGSYIPAPGDTMLLFDGTNFFRVPVTSVL